MVKCGMVRGEAGGKIGLPHVAVIVQHLPRYGAWSKKHEAVFREE